MEDRFLLFWIGTLFASGSSDEASKVGKCCVFPFTYSNTSYTSCITTRDDKPWCATISNYDQYKRWGNCDKDKTCTRGCTRTTLGDCCVFPFLYRGKRYHKCITINHNRPWCAITDNYPTDKAWGNCVQEETNKVHYAMASRPFENCNSVCERLGMICTPTNHGFPYDNAMSVFRHLNISCANSPHWEKWYGRYQFSDNPGFYKTGQSAGRCVGWKRIPDVINCGRSDNKDIRRVCPCLTREDQSNQTRIWGPWGEWSECSRSCGGGEMWRWRECKNNELCKTAGQAYEKSSCNRHICLDVKVRLRGGRSRNEGIVQLLYNNEWGTICHEFHRPGNGRVICRMLGYEDVISHRKSSTLSIKGPIWLMNLICQGNEQSIAQCGHRGWGVLKKCSHLKDLFVTCQPGINSTKIPVAPRLPVYKPSGRLPSKAIIGIVFGLLAVAFIGFGVTTIYLKKRSNWDISREQIVFEDVLGVGAFGKVYKAQLLETPDLGKFGRFGKGEMAKQSFPVAVKMLQGSKDEDKNQFLEEIKLMKQVGSHPNIVNMIGCCQDEPLLLVVEYAAYGNLLQFLRKNRTKLSAEKPAAIQEDESPTKSLIDGTSIDNEEKGLSAKDLLSFAWQSAKGMDYLSSKGFVHRDVAARNVLVDKGKVAKISDFGLSRKLQESENIYYCKARRKMPIKWMSPEAIYDMTFTVKSDVWAFGVLLWEIATIGGNPYPSLSNHEVYKSLKLGYRMEKPDICSQELYNLMTMCWKERPEERPSFSCLQSKLEKIMTEMSSYLDLTSLDPSSSYYMDYSSSSSSSSGSN